MVLSRREVTVTNGCSVFSNSSDSCKSGQSCLLVFIY